MSHATCPVPLRQATTAVAQAMLDLYGICVVHDVPYDGVPYATITPQPTIHTTDLLPGASNLEVAEHYYIKVHECGHLARIADFDIFTDDTLKAMMDRLPYAKSLANVFIDGPTDHLQYGKYKGADLWRDEGRLHYQTKLLPESPEPMSEDRRAIVMTAAGLVDCQVRARTYPKSSRALQVYLRKASEGSVVNTLVDMSSDIIERFRHLYMDADADNTEEILKTIRDMLDLWEPHLPPEPESESDDDGGNGGESGEPGESEEPGESGGSRENPPGDESGDGDSESGDGTDAPGEQSGEQGGEANGESPESVSPMDALAEDHEEKAEKLDRGPAERAPAHTTDIVCGKPTHPDNSGYIPAPARERYQFILGTNQYTDDNGIPRPYNRHELLRQNQEFLRSGQANSSYVNDRAFDVECIQEVCGDDAALRKLQIYLQSKFKSGKKYGQRSGKLNKRLAYRTVANVPDDKWRERVFTKRTDKPNPKGTAITLGIDMSTSMNRTITKRGQTRHHIAAGSIVKLAKALDLIGVTYEVFSYTLDWGGGGVVNVVHKEFTEKIPTGTLLRRLAAFSPLGANADGESIAMAGDRLLTMPHDRKVMIVLSDGAPRTAGIYADWINQNMYEGKEVPDDPCGGYLKGVVQNLADDGVEVVGLGIDTDNVKEYYPHSRSITAENLGEQLIDVLKEII